MARFSGAAAHQFTLYGFKLRPVDDRRMMSAKIHLFLLSAVAHFFMGEKIRRTGFFLQQIAAVLFISEQPQHHGG